MADLEQGERPFAALLEIQTRPDGTMPGRLLLAGGLALLLLKPNPLPGDRYELLAIVVNLTGKGNSARSMALGRTRWILLPAEVDLETLDAREVLAGIEKGSIPRLALAWIPLMQQGGDEATITRWLALAGAEADLGRRGDYSLALVFSEAVGLRPKWSAALEGFNMIESDLVREWKIEARNEGKKEGKAEALLQVVQRRYPDAPQALKDAIRACRDTVLLDRWLDCALAADSLDLFRQQTGL